MVQRPTLVFSTGVRLLVKTEDSVLVLSISYGTVTRSFFGIEVTILYLRIVGLVQFPSSFKISEFYCDDGVIIVHSEGLLLRWLRFRKPFSIFQLHALVKRKTYMHVN